MMDVAIRQLGTWLGPSRMCVKTKKSISEYLSLLVSIPDYRLLDLLSGFAWNLDSDFIKKNFFIYLFFLENSHIQLDLLGVMSWEILRDPGVYRSKGFRRQTNTQTLSTLYIKIIAIIVLVPREDPINLRSIPGHLLVFLLLKPLHSSFFIRSVKNILLNVRYTNLMQNFEMGI